MRLPRRNKRDKLPAMPPPPQPRVVVVLGAMKMTVRTMEKFGGLYGCGGSSSGMPGSSSAGSLCLDLAYKDALLTPSRGIAALAKAIMASQHPVHLHVLSGSAFRAHLLFRDHPEVCGRVASQVFDSPCHARGLSASFSTHFPLVAPFKPHIEAALSKVQAFSNLLDISNKFMGPGMRSAHGSHNIGGGRRVA